MLYDDLSPPVINFLSYDDVILHYVNPDISDTTVWYKILSIGSLWFVVYLSKYEERKIVKPL